AMQLHRTLMESTDVYLVEILAAADISYFEAEQSIDIHEDQCVGSVDRKRTDDVVKWPHCARDLVGLGIGNREDRRLQAGHVDMGAIGGVDGVMGSGFGLDGVDDVARRGVHHMPGRPFELWNVQGPAV